AGEERRQPLARVGQVALVDDVVPLEHARSLPAADALDNVLAHAGAPIVAGPGTAEGVEEKPRQSDRLARPIPPGVEAPEVATVAMEYVGRLGHAERPPARDEREQLTRQGEHERPLVLRDGTGELDAAPNHLAVLDLQAEPGPHCPERVPPSETRQIGKLSRVRDGRLIQLAEFPEEPREFWRVNEPFAGVVLGEERDGWPARQLSRAYGEREHAGQRRQLAGDRRPPLARLHARGGVPAWGRAAASPAFGSAVMSSALSKPNVARRSSTLRAACRSERLPFTR